MADFSAPLFGRRQIGIDRAGKGLLRRLKCSKYFTVGEIVPNDHQIDVTFCCFIALGHRAIDKGAIDRRPVRGQSIANGVNDANSLQDQLM